MSIRTYFENIAAAIKEKNTDITTVTPSEMPAAIRSIPSGGEEMTVDTLFTNPTFNTRPNVTLAHSIFDYKMLVVTFHRQYSTQSQIMTAVLTPSAIEYFIQKATSPVTNIKFSAVAADGWILYRYVDETHLEFEIASSNMVWIDMVEGIK